MPSHLPLLLGLGLLLGSPADPDLGQLQEMLYDRQDARAQSQAAMLLIQSKDEAAAKVVRHALKQADQEDAFVALTTAIRLRHDTRFGEDLFPHLGSMKPRVRQVTADAREYALPCALAEWYCFQSGHHLVLQPAPEVRHERGLPIDAHVVSGKREGRGISERAYPVQLCQRMNGAERQVLQQCSERVSHLQRFRAQLGGLAPAAEKRVPARKFQIIILRQCA